jgi:hypothetical protein
LTNSLDQSWSNTYIGNEIKSCPTWNHWWYEGYAYI